MIVTVAITCNITIDADLYSSRVTPRGLFRENNERALQKNVVVGQAQTCSEFIINIQVRPQRLPLLSFLLRSGPCGPAEVGTDESETACLSNESFSALRTGCVFPVLVYMATLHY